MVIRDFQKNENGILLIIGLCTWHDNVFHSGCVTELGRRRILQTRSRRDSDDVNIQYDKNIFSVCFWNDEKFH